MNRKIILVLLILGASVFNSSQAQEDSTLFSYQDFYNLVIENHPVVKMAGLQIDFAAADLMMARGGFDPKVVSDFDRKSIGGEDYFNHWVSQLKVPLWGGIDLKVEREQNTGARLNPELSNRQTFTGFSVPVGKGLLMEERRSTLMQSKIYQNISVAEQQKMVNKIVFSGAKDYWEWYLSYQTLLLNQEAFQLAADRFNLIKEQARVGEKAPIDSVEAKITLQTRKVNLANARVDFRNSGLMLSNYMWNKAEQPLLIPETFIPPPIPSYLLTSAKLEELIDLARNSHPEITKLILKNEQYEIQRRLARESFKPALDVDFGYLDTPKYNFSDYGLFNSNHKLGVNFSVPLFMRKERGKMQQVKIKILENQLDRRQLSREILNEVQMAYNEAKNLEAVIGIQEEAGQLQGRLLEAERLKFSIGESNLFLINSRENKLLDIRIKIQELKTKYEKAVASLVYAAGLSNLN